MRPRKCQHASDVGVSCPRFNGAAALRPRKWPSLSRQLHAPGVASMGPRPCGRGNRNRVLGSCLARRASMGPRPCGRGNRVRSGAQRLTAGRLQWGRGLAAAEIRRMKQSGIYAIWLQWGRGLAAAEILVAYLLWLLPARLQWGRGLAAAEMARPARPVLPIRRASMGPRPCGRGNVHLLALLRYGMQRLQWGRGLAAAEMGK